MSGFEDRIPEDDWDHLGIVTPGGEYLPTDQSYRSAARYLAHLIREQKAHFERLNQADQQPLPDSRKPTGSPGFAGLGDDRSHQSSCVSSATQLWSIGLACFDPQ